MKKLLLIILLTIPASAFAERFEVTVIDQCNGMDRVAVYSFRTLSRARELRNLFRNRTGVKATWIKRIK